MIATPELDREIRQVLLELMLVSNGTTPSYNPSGGQSAETALWPAGDKRPPHLYWAKQYELQETDTGRRAVITSAREELERLSRRDPNATGGESADQLIQAMLKATEGWTPQDVERSNWRMSARLVRKHRTLADRHPDTGLKVNPDAADPDADNRGRAREMKDGGYTQRQIAMLIGVPKSTVGDWLKAAA